MRIILLLIVIRMSPQTVLPMPTKEFLLQKKKEHEQALALQKYKDD